MSGLILESHVNQAKEQTQGNPDKIAQYQTLKMKFRQQNKELFTEDNPLLGSTTDEVILQQGNQAVDGDEDEYKRYLIQKDRHELQKAQRERKASYKHMPDELRQKIADGNVTQSDLDKATELARNNNRPEFISIYSTIKRMLAE